MACRIHSVFKVISDYFLTYGIQSTKIMKYPSYYISVSIKMNNRFINEIIFT